MCTLVACYEHTDASSAEKYTGIYQQLCAHIAGLHSTASLCASTVYMKIKLSAVQAHVYALVACYERTEAISADMEEDTYRQLCLHVAGLHSGASLCAPST